MYLDSVSEAIAHFIGLFEVTREEARLREAHDSFTPTPVVTPDTPAHEAIKVDAPSDYSLDDYVPGVSYTPLAPELVAVVPSFSGLTAPHHLFGGGHGLVTHTVSLTVAVPAGSASLALAIPPSPPDLPGSVILSAHQQVTLSDDDVVHVGGARFDFQPLHDYGGMLEGLVHDARLDLPLGAGDPPGSTAEIKDAILSTAGTADSLFHQVDGSGTPYYLADAPALSGVTVDGTQPADVPLLKDHLPDPPGGLEPASSSSHSLAMTDHGATGGGALTLEAGGNTLVNSASLANGNLTAPVVAILGDHFETNTIVQMNVWSDHDSVAPSLAASLHGPATEGFNIAAFNHTDAAAGQPAIDPAKADYPHGWHVDTLNGNVVFLDWINQVNFVSDNDISTYSSTGATTLLSTGANTAINGLSFADLGHYYDLIIVGGSMLSANAIHQTNVLLDNDFVTALNGFQTSGTASVSSGGNLLWNAAEITHVGGADRFQALPDSFRQAAADLAAGKTGMSAGLAGDPAFAGYHGLHALYISGDVLQLQMISQTNVLGDADQVALLKDSFANSMHAPDVTVSTGSNALVNQASITSLDTTGKVTYVGGEHYSDDILFQAELVKPAAETLGGSDPGHVAYEAIAFMDNHPVDPAHDGAGSTMPSHTSDLATHDAMHTMLG
ncbi:MAG: hypothetical protein ACTHJ3_16570 [Pararhizobium sp.]